MTQERTKRRDNERKWDKLQLIQSKRKDGKMDIVSGGKGYREVLQLYNYREA